MEVWAIKVLWNLGNHSSENLSKKVLPIQDGAPPLTGSPKENYIKAIASAVLINHANETEYPNLGTPGNPYKEITTNMLIYNSDTGKNEYILLGIYIGRHPETGNLQVTTFYPIVKI